MLEEIEEAEARIQRWDRENVVVTRCLLAALVAIIIILAVLF